MNDLIGVYQVQCKSLKHEGLSNLELNNYCNFKDIFSKYEFELIMKEKQNRKNKRNRTKKRFMELLVLSNALSEKNGKLVFGTVTVNNEYLEKTEQTRIKIIEKWLKSHFLIVILNKDFGSKTEREHYHFVGVTTENIEDTGKKSKKGYKIFELEKKDYKIGFEPTLCIIDLNLNDTKKTINYLLKLNNHSSKTTTRNRVRIIKSDTYKKYEWFIEEPFKNSRKHKLALVS